MKCQKSLKKKETPLKFTGILSLVFLQVQFIASPVALSKDGNSLALGVLWCEQHPSTADGRVVSRPGKELQQAD